MRHRMARTVALVLSAGLGVFVIVNAQFGCDSPASNPPPAKNGASVEPAKVSEPQPQPEPQPQAQPQPAPEPNPPAVKVEPAPEPVYMPASKSGGDFGSMRFPGEGSQAPQQQANPAPK
jgi:hypothetical protein